jgi:hypothetical protein
MKIAAAALVLCDHHPLCHPESAILIGGLRMTMRYAGGVIFKAGVKMSLRACFPEFATPSTFPKFDY